MLDTCCLYALRPYFCDSSIPSFRVYSSASQNSILSQNFDSKFWLVFSSQNFWLAFPGQNFESKFWLEKFRVKISSQNSGSKFRVIISSQNSKSKFRVIISSQNSESKFWATSQNWTVMALGPKKYQKIARMYCSVYILYIFIRGNHYILLVKNRMFPLLNFFAIKVVAQITWASSRHKL